MAPEPLTSGVSGAPAQTGRDGIPFRKALARFGPYLWRHRLRVALVLGTGLLAGFFAKLPLVFLEPLVNDVLGIRTVVAASHHAHAPERPFFAFVSESLIALRSRIVTLLPGLDASGDPTQEGRFGLLVAICASVVVVSLLGGFLHFTFLQLSRGLSMRILAEIREDLAAHVLKLDMRYHTSSRKGDLLSRVTTDVNIVLTAMSLAFDDLVLEPAQVVFTIGIATVSSPMLTLLVLLLVPMVAVPLLYFGKRVRRGTRRSLGALGESTETMSQMFAGIRVVKAFRMEDAEMRDFREANKRWISRAMKVVRAKALTESTTHFLIYATFAALLCAIGYAHLQGGTLTDLGALSVWIAGFAPMYQHTRRISKAYQVVQESMGASERLFEILDREPSTTAVGGGTALVSRPIETLEFRNVSFAYEGEPVLDGVSFLARAGEVIAIVGPSGAGKSTLIDLVARFYEPNAGAIYVNGVDIRTIHPDLWYSLWALVDQHPFLFHASIRENVAYGKPDATDEQIRDALRASNLLEFVDSLPKGIDTEVGDRGARLSGGQRQRLTIARALLKDPAILLLDEVTSALDAESETIVREALDRLMAGRTSLVVAHRLSTVRQASRILVLDRGRIVEEGTHDELLAAGGLYRRVYEMQFGETAS